MPEDSESVDERITKIMEAAQFSQLLMGHSITALPPYEPISLRDHIATTGADEGRTMTPLVNYSDSQGQQEQVDKTGNQPADARPVVFSNSTGSAPSTTSQPTCEQSIMEKVADMKLPAKAPGTANILPPKLTMFQESAAQNDAKDAKPRKLRKKYVRASFKDESQLPKKLWETPNERRATAVVADTDVQRLFQFPRAIRSQFKGHFTREGYVRDKWRALLDKEDPDTNQPLDPNILKSNDKHYEINRSRREEPGVFNHKGEKRKRKEKSVPDKRAAGKFVKRDKGDN